MSKAKTKTLLGIDIHDLAVHVCQVRATDLGPEIVQAWTEEIPEGNEHFSNRAADVLRRVVRQNRLSGNKACVAVPDDHVLFSNVLMPTDNRAEIAGMAALRMERHAMLSAGDSVVAHAVLDTAQPGGTRVGIAAATKLHVQERLDILRSAGLNPHMAVSGGMAAARYFSHYIKNDKKPCLVLYGQAHTVSIYIVSAAGLLMAHCVGLSGNGAPESDAVIRGIRLAVENMQDGEPGRIIMCGDAHGIPHPSILEQALALPVSVSVGDEYTATGLLDTIRAAGAALEMDPAAGSGANLVPRRTARESRGPRNTRMWWAVLLVLAIACAACGGLAVTKANARSTDLKKAQQRLDTLEPRMDAMRKQKEFVEAFSSIDAAAVPTLDVLLALSQTLPSNVYVTNLVMDRGMQVTATAETTGQDTVASVIAALESAPMFDNVQLVYSRRAGAGAAPIVTFEVKATMAGETNP
jgi:Tfp pilus assembly protein PilN